MKKWIIIIIVLIILVLLGVLYFFAFRKSKPAPIPEPPPTPTQTQESLPLIIPHIMTISSSAFTNRPAKEGEELIIPRKYTCDGRDINPPLQISGTPVGAKSLALIVDDPDAPRGTWVHWTVWNTSPEITSIAENSVPTGAVEGTTDFGRTGYGGPCPPSGTHRYFFKIYALDTFLNNLQSSATKADLEQAMQNHILDRAELVGLYKRS